jgi:hypothetical protein
MACTWASAFSPEKSSQIFLLAFCGNSVLARSQAARRSSAAKLKVDRALRRSMLKERRRSRDFFVIARGAHDPLLRFSRQSESAEDALQIIVAIILNLNPPAFLPVVQGYPRAEMFL